MAGNRRGRWSSPLSPPPQPSSPPIPPTPNPCRQGSRVRSTNRRSQAERDVDAVFERNRLSREANFKERAEKKAAKAAIALEKKAIAQRAKNEKAEAKAREAARKN